MFCPKCGNELSEDAAFCAKCGNQIGGRARQGAANSVRPQAAASASSIVGAMSTQTIGALIAAIVAVVCMFLPWVHNSYLSQLGTYGSYVGANVKDSATVFGLADMMEQFGGSSAQPVYMIITAVWVAVLALLVIGIIFSIRDKKPAILLIVGGAAAVVGALAWCWLFMVVAGGNEYTVTLPVWITLIAGIAVIVLSVMGRKAA